MKIKAVESNTPNTETKPSTENKPSTPVINATEAVTNALKSLTEGKEGAIVTVDELAKKVGENFNNHEILEVLRKNTDWKFVVGRKGAASRILVGNEVAKYKTSNPGNTTVTRKHRTVRRKVRTEAVETPKLSNDTGLNFRLVIGDNSIIIPANTSLELA